MTGDRPPPPDEMGNLRAAVDPGSTDRWNRIKELFRHALECAREERTAFLDEECRGDPELRSEVEALLAAHDETRDFLEPPPGATLEAVGPGEGLCGSSVGQYRIERVISAGGMGVVYEATQESPQRTVAVKVLNESFPSRSARRRFQVEAQILARLTHPGIAQVFEAGIHRPDAGARGEVPYFVMELVPGARSLTEHARDARLRVAERLRLFLQVVDAVHHAHLKGVIHRDLKPSNLLVDAAGKVKVIDFGVARATDADVRLTTAGTDVGQLLGTLQYMSPEQCAGDPRDLDVRSDVYALGVVLYELLCEGLPYEVGRVPLPEATRLVREAEPRRPSTAKRSLRGDVETIVLKALEKEPDRRYQSASELADDIRRHLSGDVIRARPAGPVTRTLKRIRRDPVLRTTLLVAVPAAAALVAYVAFISYPQIRHERDLAREEGENARIAERAALAARDEADAARGTAEEEAELSRAVNGLVFGMLSSPGVLRSGRDVRVVDVLDEAAEQLGAAYADRPRIEADLRRTLGKTYRGLGWYEAAEVQLRAAVELAERVHGPDHATTLYGRSHLARTWTDLARHAEAEAELRAVTEAMTRTLGAEHRGTLEARYFLARELDLQGAEQEAEELLVDVYAVQQRVLGEADRDTLYTGHLLVQVFVQLGRYADAVELAEETIALSRATLGEEHPDTIDHLHSLASSLERAGRAQEAEPIYRDLIEQRTRLDGEEHPQTIAALEGLAILLTRRGKLAEAETLLRRVLEIARRTRGDEHPTTLDYLNNLGIALARQGKLDEATEVFAEVAELRSRKQGEEHSNTIGARTNLAGVMRGNGDLAGAEAELRDVLAIRERVSGGEHPHTLQVRRLLAEVLIDRRKIEEAEPLCRDVLAVAQETLGEAHPDALGSAQILARLLLVKGDFAEADELLYETIELARTGLPPAHSTTANLLRYHGRCLLEMGRLDEAVTQLGEAYDLYLQTTGASHHQAKSCARTMIELHELRGDSEQADLWRTRLATRDD